MAWHTIDHVCGHSQRVQIYGPTRDRDRKAEWHASRLCPDCFAVQQERERAEAGAKAAEAAKAAGLPTLTGTDKQVSWAEQIRDGARRGISAALVRMETVLRGQGRVEVADAAEECDAADLARVGGIADMIEELPPVEGERPESLPKAAAMLRAWVEIAGAYTSARWWIDARDRLSPAALAETLAAEKKAAEERRAADLKREEVEQYRESVRIRLHEILPGHSGWELKVGTWSGCKRVYFGGGYSRNFATLHVTGDRHHSPGSMEGGGNDEPTRAALKSLLAEVAAKWNTIEIQDSKG